MPHEKDLHGAVEQSFFWGGNYPPVGGFYRRTHGNPRPFGLLVLQKLGPVLEVRIRVPTFVRFCLFQGNPPNPRGQKKGHLVGGPRKRYLLVCSDQALLPPAGVSRLALGVRAAALRPLHEVPVLSAQAEHCLGRIAGPGSLPALP